MCQNTMVKFNVLLKLNNQQQISAIKETNYEKIKDNSEIPTSPVRKYQTKKTQIFKLKTSSNVLKPNSQTTKSIVNYSKSTDVRIQFQKFLQPSLSYKHRKEMLELLRVFKHQMEIHNITYFLYGGSLIGLIRHHGIIPWDDDIDIIIDGSKKAMVKKALAGFNKTYDLTSNEDIESSKWKFYKIDGKSFNGLTFRYPYLDLFYFKNEDDATIKAENLYLYFAKANIFPLITRNFEGMNFPTPCNIDGVLKVIYGELICSSNAWNHSMEYPITDRKFVECNSLRPYLPFTTTKMETKKDEIEVTETLKRNNTIIQIVKFNLPMICSGKNEFYDSKLTKKIFI